jgi:hypothetical protein
VVVVAVGAGAGAFLAAVVGFVRHTSSRCRPVSSHLVSTWRVGFETNSIHGVSQM